MASSNKCSICKKAVGTCLCAGCKACFCGPDFKDHRGELFHELDGLSEDSNNLRDKINKITQHDELDSSLFSRIDEWQQTTIEKVNQAAEEARKEVIKLMNSKRTELTNQFETLSQELKELRETEGFIEQDLTRLQQVICQLNEDLENLTQLTAIKLDVVQSDQIAWNQLINVRNNESAYSGDQQRSTVDKFEISTRDIAASTSPKSKIPLIPIENIKFSFSTTDQRKQKLTDKKKFVEKSSSTSNPTSQLDNKPSFFGNFNSNSCSPVFGSSPSFNNIGGGSSLKTSTNTNAGFSFPSFGNTAATTITSTGFQFSTPAVTTANTSSIFSFGSAAANKSLFGSSPKFSFSDLAKQSTNNNKLTTNGTEQRVFAGQGSLIFGTSSANTTTTENKNEDDSYEPNILSKPIVPLSAVEVKTGEEDENILFCERAKLYRFDDKANQMKERGVGEMKILQHKTTNRCRILMRREQVLKLCANHLITSQMELKPHSGSENAYIWSAMDFADGEAKHETLCIKFKSSDIAKRFFQQFNDAQIANANAQQ